MATINQRVTSLEGSTAPGRWVIKYERDWQDPPRPVMVDDVPDPDYTPRPTDQLIVIRYVDEWRGYSGGQ